MACSVLGPLNDREPNGHTRLTTTLLQAKRRKAKQQPPQSEESPPPEQEEDESQSGSASSTDSSVNTSRSIKDELSIHEENTDQVVKNSSSPTRPRQVVIVGAGWGGLSAAYRLACCSGQQPDGSMKGRPIQVTVIDGAQRVGGIVRDGYTTQSGLRPAEAGQHGFWYNYRNIYRFLQGHLFPPSTLATTGTTSSAPTTNTTTTTTRSIRDVLSDYAEQGQWSPRGLEAVWPVYQQQSPTLPTGLAQAAYTTFLNLPLIDRMSAFPLVLAFSEFDNSPEAWQRFDSISFRDLCIRLGVSQRCYNEAFEPMILTGLFAPGAQCSAAAALGMAYFFVLQSQKAFDVQWCRGNIGDVIFAPWVEILQENGVKFEMQTFITNVTLQNDTITHIHGQRRNDHSTVTWPVDDLVMAVGANALNNLGRTVPALGQYSEFQRFTNLRGTSVLATRLFFDRRIRIPYSANACWGFDRDVGMTMFDIRSIHGERSPTVLGAPGAVIEVDYYHANSLLALSDEEIVCKVKRDLDILVGKSCQMSTVVDAAVVRLPGAVNWYFPGSWQDMPQVQSTGISNLYYAGDIVRTSHGSWSQEKAFVTGIQAANVLLGRPIDETVLPLTDEEEGHVRLGRDFVKGFRGLWKRSRAPSLADFIW